MNQTAILLCKCRGDHFVNVTYRETEDYLSGLDADLFVVDDLCASVFTHAAELNALKDSYSSIIILACQPRAVKHLLIQQLIDFNNATFINFRDNGITPTLEELKSLPVEPGYARIRQMVSGLDVPSWFPVVDQERCTGCGRCAGFCLFGVYRAEEAKVIVQQPLNCKNNCPACARTCPASAIIFPKIAEGGVISGAEPPAREPGLDSPRESLTSRLADRKEMRSSILKESVFQQANKNHD